MFDMEGFPLSRLDRAVEVVQRMLRARAALQLILGNKYCRVVPGWASFIKEKMQLEKKSPIEVVCDLAEREFDSYRQLILLAAAIEVVEEEARACGGDH